jgi:uncharacterized membrane protein YjgN (DUF898 family)
MVLLVITVGIYTPWAYCQLKRWEVDNTDFADNAILPVTHGADTPL